MSSRPDCIFEIHQLWQSGYSRVYSNCCCSCLLEPEIIKISQSSHKIYSNNIVNFQESTTICKACTKQSGNLLIAPRNLFINKKRINSAVNCEVYSFFERVFSYLRIVSKDFAWVNTEIRHKQLKVPNKSGPHSPIVVLYNIYIR